ncbi:hypothetical protein Ade02nite_44570 [Paractinoplanes deccanensis]|uniref:Uncharacterized protein n=1 Tax=Paractinoplanes deccanensis TaxID=113561 RepID=A0ABQ3Y741_9ACTN|nr:hypothetical protein [Actinoplanes deccanensis]GID75816.1 hypothetical protein Ade02nite_44570 [Actinoplanes deccanensis]
MTKLGERLRLFLNKWGQAPRLAGIALSLSRSTGTDRYVVSGLAGLGALLSGFLANTFAKSVRQAGQQLNLY